MPQKEAALVNYLVEWREEFGVNSNIHVWTHLTAVVPETHKKAQPHFKHALLKGQFYDY